MCSLVQYTCQMFEMQRYLKYNQNKGFKSTKKMLQKN